MSNITNEANEIVDDILDGITISGNLNQMINDGQLISGEYLGFYENSHLLRDN